MLNPVALIVVFAQSYMLTLKFIALNSEICSVYCVSGSIGPKLVQSPCVGPAAETWSSNPIGKQPIELS